MWGGGLDLAFDVFVSDGGEGKVTWVNEGSRECDCERRAEISGRGDARIGLGMSESLSPCPLSVGGEGSSFMVHRGGLVLLGFDIMAMFSFSSTLSDGRDNFRGLLFSGIDEMRSGMIGGWPSKTDRLGLRCLRVGFGGVAVVEGKPV